jgi:HAD superfamily hydrolase (TIGR01509 family)
MIHVWAELRVRYPPGLELEEWLTAINTEYVNDPQPMPSCPGAVEVIRTLAVQGVPQVCVSNSSRIVVRANIRTLGIGDCLAGIVTLDDVNAGKPDPEPYVKACKCLGLDATEVLAIEDSLSGVQSAAAAGLSVIGYAPAGTVLEGATQTIQDLLEVLESLQQ